MGRRRRPNPAGDDGAPRGPGRVLVVGAGPAGLVAALTLARYGVEVVLVEKRAAISTLSRAVVVSTRNMEILRSWGLEDAIRARAADVEPRGWLTPTLAAVGTGREIPLGYPTRAEAAGLSPTRPAWISQDLLEPLLLERLHGTPEVSVHFGTELVDFRSGAGGVVAVLRDVGTGRTRELSAAYLLGADGAHSTVREAVGIGTSGPGTLAAESGADFEADLTGLLGDRRYGLTVITRPDVAGVLSPRGAGDRWHYGWDSRPGQPLLTDLSAADITGMIAAACGDPAVRPRIVRVSTFSFAARIADRYSAGRAFLLGDAAHQMTPRGGTGMNTAIQDGYDLGWKLGWVLRGWAPETLLAEYERDRRPVAEHNVDRSADPHGARRQAEEAVRWDLNGRVPHRRLRLAGRTMSTVDLLGEGYTLLAGPGGPGELPAGGAPVTVHTLAGTDARALGIPAGGGLLLRPDGREPGQPVPAAG